jgi:hypothetical protein
MKKNLILCYRKFAEVFYKISKIGRIYNKNKQLQPICLLEKGQSLSEKRALINSLLFSRIPNFFMKSKGLTCGASQVLTSHPNSLRQ